MEQRRYPRIQLPLLVELKHPTLGTHRCIARDISEGGVFVYTDKPQVKPGAKVRITLQNTLNVETQPTPTVEMSVTRVEDDGLGLEFVNVTGRHLWQSVERVRTELAIGRDYFQVHVNVIASHAGSAILLAQQHGKWLFPATFLEVGKDWQGTVREFLRRDFGITVTGLGGVVDVSSASRPEVPEAAVLDLFVEVQTSGDTPELPDGSRYRSARWVDRRRDVEDSTFASEQQRQLADAVLKRLIRDNGTPGEPP